MKKANEANSNSTLELRITVGNDIFDAEEYQLIRRQHVKQSPIMDLDAIQRARFTIRPRICEDVIVA